MKGISAYGCARIVALSGTGLLALAASATSAQVSDQPKEETAASGARNTAETGIADIVVTAERRATNLQDTPISIVAVTQEAIAAKGIEDLQDLSAFTPNLTISASRGTGNNSPNFGIRGIGGGNGATGERGVGLYIDGVYVPRTSGAILRVLDIDRIEVLRGPQGTLFGRNSTGGAIRIFSKQPTNDAEGYLRGTYGSFDRTDLTAMVNLPLSDTARRAPIWIRMAMSAAAPRNWGRNAISSAAGCCAGSRPARSTPRSGYSIATPRRTARHSFSASSTCGRGSRG
jgi:iron complex outermembrane receptor protein